MPAKKDTKQSTANRESYYKIDGPIRWAIGLAIAAVILALGYAVGMSGNQFSAGADTTTPTSTIQPSSDVNFEDLQPVTDIEPEVTAAPAPTE